MRPEEYEVGLGAYLAEPTVAVVQKALGCGQDVAARLVYEGLPKLGLKPLEERRKEEARLVAAGQRRVQAVVEKSAARVATEMEVVVREAAEAGLARQRAVLGDGLVQLEEEARLVKANRDGAQALAVTNARLLRVADRLAGALEKKLDLAAAAATKDGEVDPEVFFEKAELTMMQGLGVIRTIANIGQRIAESSKHSVDMARLLSGDPTNIVKVTGGAGEAMTPEQGAAWMEKSARAWARLQERKRAVDAILEETAVIAAPQEAIDLEELEDAES